MRLQLRPAPGWIAGMLAISWNLLNPSPASAACISAAACLCRGGPVDEVLIVTVTSVGNTDFKAAVDSVVTRPGDTPAFVQGDAVAMRVDDAPDPPKVGEQLLISYAEERLLPVTRVDGDDKITCRYAPEYRPDASHAAELILSDSCHEDTSEEIGPVECNDTVTYFGCATGDGDTGRTGAPWAALGALGLAIAAARRRRRA